MTNPICVTCGVQYEAGGTPSSCPICTDERQYVGHEGQQWTTLDDLRRDHAVVLRREVLKQEALQQEKLRQELVRHDTPEHETGGRQQSLWGIGVEPSFAIGQRALVVPGDGGNLLWDCVSVIDDEAVRAVKDLGGLAAIAISHPHYYSCMIEWSEAFGGIPVYIHASDAQWVQRRGNVVFWQGDSLEVLPGRTLLNPRIHFAGGTVVHWPGIDGRGALCSGDIFQVVADRRWVSFMYSYPNLIPEHPDTIRRAVQLVRPYDFEVIYGAWWGRVVTSDAKAAVIRSAERYLRHLGMTL